MSKVEIYIGHLIRRLHQQSTAIFVDEMAAANLDLTPMQYGALAEIENSQGIDQARLAELVACDRATLGGIVDRLEKKALITRKISSNDRRARVLELTPSGRELFNEAKPIVERLPAKIIGNLNSEEEAQLVALINKALIKE